MKACYRAAASTLPFVASTIRLARHACFICPQQRLVTKLTRAPILMAQTPVQSAASAPADDFWDRAARDREWVDVVGIQNALLGNHFLDVLEVHGERYGLRKDESYDGWNEAGCYALRMRRLGREFRRQVTGAFARRLGFENIACVSAATTTGAAEMEREATRRAMKQRTKMIVGGILGDPQRRITARVPMLLRMDAAREILPVMPECETNLSDDLYVAVGVKRRPVATASGGAIKKSILERVQEEMSLWNRLLTDIQGTDVGHAVLVGLKPKRRKAVALGAVLKDDETDPTQQRVFDDKTWTVASVPFQGGSRSSGSSALQALRWRIGVVDNGVEWIEDALRRGAPDTCLPNIDKNGIFTLASTATDARLRPNMKCASMYDWPWSQAKKRLAKALCELTLVSGISRTVSEKAMENGVPNNYCDESVTGESLGVKSHFTSITLAKCKPSYSGPSVTPSLIPHNGSNWRRLQNFNRLDVRNFSKSEAPLPLAEERTFYIDFELASPDYLYSVPAECELNMAAHDAFYDVQPSRPLQDEVESEALIFMIGCGQVINGEWRHEVFIADALSKEAESSVVRRWLERMNELNPSSCGNPILYVWGPEQQLLKKAFRRMTPADSEAVKDIKHYELVDMLQVVISGALSIKGGLNNSIKTVATCLENLGLLGDFDGRPTSHAVQTGVDAMALALDAVEAVQRDGLDSLAGDPHIKLISTYNEADCRDIARIAAYLRQHH